MWRKYKEKGISTRNFLYFVEKIRVQIGVAQKKSALARNFR